MKPVQNNVIIKMDTKYHEKTKSGILTPTAFVADETYTSRGYHVMRNGIVKTMPEKIVKDKVYSSWLPYHLDITNHTVYFHPIDITAGKFITENDTLHLLLKYHTLLLATTPYIGQKYNEKEGQLSEDKSSIIKPLNGNLIVKRIKEPPNKLSPDLIEYKDHIVKVIYSGVPNVIEYEESKNRNDIVKAGDTCIVRNVKFPPIEYNIYANMSTDLKVIKRSDVLGILQD